MLADGYHDVPPGKVASVVTHLEMRAPFDLMAALPEGLLLVRERAPEVERYRNLFRRVGGQDWLWFSRLRISDEDLQAVLTAPDVAVFILQGGGGDAGLLELDFRAAGACELAYFGVVRELVGRGAGRAMMARAIDEAFSREITRFHVHTCTLDSPQALGFYQSCGFVPVRQQIEIADDPRLTGDLRRDAGAHVPVFDGA